MAKLSKDDILEAVDAMTVLELAELVEALKDKYNVSAAPVAVAAAPAGDGAADRIPVRVSLDQRSGPWVGIFSRNHRGWSTEDSSD